MTTSTNRVKYCRAAHAFWQLNAAQTTV